MTTIKSSHPVRKTLTQGSVSARKPLRGATRQTSKQSASVAAASATAGSGAADFVRLSTVDWVSSSSSLSRLKIHKVDLGFSLLTYKLTDTQSINVRPANVQSCNFSAPFHLTCRSWVSWLRCDNGDVITCC